MKEPKYASVWSYLSLAMLHLILAILAFPGHFFRPMHTVFADYGDGQKNNFTLLSYLKQKLDAGGIFKYDQMAYPFGEYVFTTDNTPFFSVPFRWFCLHIYDLSDYGLAFFNFWMIANIILCGLLAFWLFKYLTQLPLLAWLMALFLPWTNFQLLRLEAGHYNLSLTSLCLMALCLFFFYVKRRHLRQHNRWVWLAMFLLSYSSFLIHGYYLVIIPVVLSLSLMGLGIYALWSKAPQALWPLIHGFLILLLSVFLAYGTLYWTDGYLALRPSGASGYDWMEQKTNISLLFSHYPFQHFFFPAWNGKIPQSIELMVYLGNIGLYSLLVLGLIALFKPAFRKQLGRIQSSIFRKAGVGSVLICGLIFLFMSLGEKYYPLKTSNHLGWPVNISDGLGRWLLGIILMGLVLNLLAYFKGRNKGESLYSLERKQEGFLTSKPLIGGALFYLSVALLIILLFTPLYIGRLNNWLNPLFWLHKFTHYVEQFRSLARFAWVFYWIFYLWIALVFAALIHRGKGSLKWLIYGLIITFGSVETIDYVAHLRENANDENLFSTGALQSIKKLPLNWEKYQAILPLPFYMVGCEAGEYNYTIDDIPEVSEFSYQLSYYSGLPLMAQKLSRTTVKHSRLLLEMVKDSVLPQEIQARLTHRPILVCLQASLAVDSSLSIIPDAHRPLAQESYWSAKKFIQNKNLKAVDSLDGFYFYEWYPLAVHYHP